MLAVSTATILLHRIVKVLETGGKEPEVHIRSLPQSDATSQNTPSLGGAWTPLCLSDHACDGLTFLPWIIQFSCSPNMHLSGACIGLHIVLYARDAGVSHWPSPSRCGGVPVLRVATIPDESSKWLYPQLRPTTPVPHLPFCN